MPGPKSPKAPPVPPLPAGASPPVGVSGRPARRDPTEPVPRAAKARQELAQAALRLRDEQLQAKVVYVDPDMQTNSELDAITAKVVEELEEMQRAGLAQRRPDDPQQVEIQLIKALRELLEKMVSPRRETFMRHKIELIQRRITNLYFTTVVHGDPEAVRSSRITAADEALFHALRRHESALVLTLEEMLYEEDRIQEDAIERFRGFQRQLLSDFLSRTMPELERLLTIYREILVVFLMRDFREQLGEFCWEVVRESRVTRSRMLTYKIDEQSFPAFRAVFERRFLEHMLQSVQQPLKEHLEAGQFRENTLQFAADPRIYAEICGVTCNMLYDYLHGEGFLDLPVNWQTRVLDEASE